MIPYREMSAALFGAWRLARLDPQGLAYFNATVAGFWRSFFAAVICAPGYIIVVAADYAQQPPPDVSDARLIAVHAIAYVIGWTAFPLAMVTVTRLLDREGDYIRYIVASNWANVLELALYLPVIGIAVSGVQAFAILPLFATVMILAYQWYVARTALRITAFQATAVVGLDLLIDLVLISSLQFLLPGATPGA